MLLSSTKMTFWSKKRFLFRLVVAAIFVLALHVLAAYTRFETQVVLLPPSIVPGESSSSAPWDPLPLYSSAAADQIRGGVIVEPGHHLEDVKTTSAAPDGSEAGDSGSEDEPWADDARQDAGQDKEEQAAQAAQAVMAPDPEYSDAFIEVLEDIRELQEKTARYVQAIFDPTDASVDRLECPAVDTARYDHLRAPTGGSHARRTYYFALDLRQVVDLLPRLFGSIVEAARFLGAGGVALAVVEGNSDDGTWDVLSALAPELEAMGVRYFLRSEGLDPAGSDDRIGNLARLRSLALEPLRNSRNATARELGLPGADLEYADDAVVVFLNDVAACAEDIRR